MSDAATQPPARPAESPRLSGLPSLLFLVAAAGGIAVLLALIWPKPSVAKGMPIASHRQADPELARTVQRVDDAFEKAWLAAGIVPVAEADPLTLARRLSLSLTGTVPALDEIRLFEKAAPTNRVGWWLERLLQDSRSADYLAERLARALVGIEDGPFLIYRRHRLVDWLSQELQKNRAYDELVRQLITARGIWTTKPEVNFVTVTVDQNDKNKGPDEAKLARRVARAFLGVRLDCVQCHDDFLGDRWKQKDFHELAAFFAPADMSMAGVRDNATRRYQVRYHGKKDDEEVQPAVPFQAELLSPAGARRDRLAAWVTHPENTAFARATVNRVWALLFNKPLVTPLDDIPLTGPYPPGLEILAEDWVTHHFDWQRLIRAIASTRAFQLASSAAEPTQSVTEAQEKAYAAFPLSRLRPEQVAGAVIQASTLHAIDARAHVFFRIQRYAQQNDFIKRYGDIGEDEFAARGGTIPQRLLLMNGQLVQEHAGENILVNASTRIAALAPDDGAAVEAAFLCTLTRRPSEKEKLFFVARLHGARDNNRKRAMEDLCWTLLNTTEFSWSH